MKKIYLILLTLLVLAIIFGCKKAGSDKPAMNKKGKPAEDTETVFAVNTTKAIKGEIKNYIELNGDVKAKNEVDVYPDVNGKIARFAKGISLGIDVYKGQIIAFIDPSRPGTQFELSPVKSTISGTITSLPIKIGSTVSVQTSIAKVGNINDLEIVTNVAEKFINKIKTNLNAIITADAYPSEKIQGVVSEVSPVVDPVTRMMELKLRLTNTNETKLKPGMFVEVKIITEQKENIVKIPSECIIKRYGEYFVFVVDHREDSNVAIVEQKTIKPGIEIDNKIEIVDGLKEGDEVVISGQTLLEDKTKVKVINSTEPLTKEDKI